MDSAEEIAKKHAIQRTSFFYKSAVLINNYFSKHKQANIQVNSRLLGVIRHSQD